MPEARAQCPVMAEFDPWRLDRWRDNCVVIVVEVKTIMKSFTHTVVGIDEDNLILRQFAFLNQFRLGMEPRGWAQNAHDAEILRRDEQSKNNGKDYYVLEGYK